MNTFQKYFVEEFYDDYRDGLLSRRAFIRRVAYITGSMAATITTMGTLGCTPSELPAPTEPMPSPEATATTPPSDPTATPSPEATATTPPSDPTATPSPAPTEEAALSETTEPTAAQLEPVPDAKSPFSVPEGDPAVISSEVSFAS